MNRVVAIFFTCVFNHSFLAHAYEYNTRWQNFWGHEKKKLLIIELLISASEYLASLSVRCTVGY